MSISNWPRWYQELLPEIKSDPRLLYPQAVAQLLSNGLNPATSGREVVRALEATFLPAPVDKLREELKATAAQLEAGNYKMKHIKFQGMDISIENEKGSTRHGVSKKTGKMWSNHMYYSYGYIRGTEGVDGDHVDVYLGPNEDAPYVYVVHQRRPDTGKYDEDKCMLGFSNEGAAKIAYLKQYDSPKFFGAITAVPLAMFKETVFSKKGEQIVPDGKERAEKKSLFADYPRTV